jgi:hypothetical protein
VDGPLLKVHLSTIVLVLSLYTPPLAATVAIRYATVRRQGEKGPDGLERQIISYPSVHIRLLPILSHAYVYIQLGKVLVRHHIPSALIKHELIPHL